jgi:pimeloyl-ACP methyl ester carboxylesterase
MTTTDADTLTYEVEDIKVIADVDGPVDGRPVILLHGGGQTRGSWRRTAQALASQGWRSVALDLPGHGESGRWPGGYSLQRMALCVRAIAEGFEHRAVLIGASLGGLVAIVAESTTPGLASSLILVDVAPSVDPAGAERVREFMRSGKDGFASLEEVAQRVHQYNPRRAASSIDGLRRNVRLRHDGRLEWHWDPRILDMPIDEPYLADCARNLTLPVMLVWGHESDVMSADKVDEFVALVPHAKVAVVRRAGHMVAGDMNDRFSASVISFLGQ